MTGVLACRLGLRLPSRPLEPNAENAHGPAADAEKLIFSERNVDITAGAKTDSAYDPVEGGKVQLALLASGIGFSGCVCARCGGEARIVGFVTEPPQVVRRILPHLERRGVDARAGPWADLAAVPG